MSQPPCAAKPIRYHRTLFISDLHLGSQGCQPQPILNFLRESHADTVYLVGDIFDIWHVGKVQWSNTHDDIISELERFVKGGTRVVYLVGNHDRYISQNDRFIIAGIELREKVIHLAADGNKYLLLHGNQADARILRWHFMTRFGSRVDAFFQKLDNRLRQSFGRILPGQSLIQRTRSTFNSLLKMGQGYESRLTTMGKAAGAQGVICGHTHRPGLRTHNDLIYANCGDWVDSLTALTEDHEGRIELVRWRPEPAYATNADFVNSADQVTARV